MVQSTAWRSRMLERKRFHRSKGGKEGSSAAHSPAAQPPGEGSGGKTRAGGSENPGGASASPGGGCSSKGGGSSMGECAADGLGDELRGAQEAPLSPSW